MTTEATTASKTTTPAKKTPGRKAGVKKATPPPLDFAALTVADAPAPTRAGTNSGPNPMLRFVQESWDARKPAGKHAKTRQTIYKGAGKTVTVPKANADQVVSYIRKAGVTLDVGTAITTDDIPGGKVKITFCAKTRKMTEEETKAVLAKMATTPATTPAT